MARSIEENWRVFIAIELPRDIRARVAKHINQLRQAVPDARASWTRAENLHLTLKFLGQIPVANVEALAEATRRTANANTSFEIAIGGCGTFPSDGQPRVLWIGVSEPPTLETPPNRSNEVNKLRSLYSTLERECAHAGFANEKRPFHPHLTIARIRQPRSARELAQLHKEIGFGEGIVRVSDLVVIRSELSSRGSRYTMVARPNFI